MDARAAAMHAHPAIDLLGMQRFRADVPEMGALYERHRWRATYNTGRPSPLGGGPRVAHAVMGVLPLPAVTVAFERVAAAQPLGEFRADYLAACDGVGVRVFGALPDMAELADRLAELCESMELAGRPLAAAWRDAPVGDEVGTRVERCATVLREYRGDGHLSVLAAAGVLGPEALIVHALWQGLRLGRQAGGGLGTVTDPAAALAFFGWKDEAEVEAAYDRLRDAGRLDHDGQLTGSARAERDAIEDTTLTLAAEPWMQLAPADRARTVELLDKTAAGLPDPTRQILAPRAASR